MTVVEEVMPENEESAIYPQKQSDSKSQGKKSLKEGLAKLCPSGTKLAQSETDVDEDHDGEEDEENQFVEEEHKML